MYCEYLSVSLRGILFCNFKHIIVKIIKLMLIKQKKNYFDNSNALADINLNI